MTQTTHTQGPWYYEVTRFMNNPNVRFDIRKKDCAGETFVLGFVYTQAEHSEANACLIAAAPELLEALENICKAIDDVSSQIGDFVQYEQARKAISKARGQSC